MQQPKNSIAGALGWKLFERFGVQGVQFVLQIILARILSPEHYGVLSLMVIFTTLANVFIQNGFNTALIQNKDVTEEDYSSVFWVSLLIASLIYGVIFFCAPLIGAFYQMPTLVMPLRVLALVLFPGALNSVQLAKVSREMNFRKVFTSNIAGIVISGGVGIAMAYANYGLWSLVVQYLLNILIACLVMRFTVKWKIRLICNLHRVRVLFRFGWKLLVSSLIDTLYQDLRSIIIGKKYDSGTLGHYNRGKNFPQFIITAVNGTVQSVILPAMSAEQDDSKKLKTLTRSSISISGYILFPLMAGLAAVAAPMVDVLLTEKWLPCVPYLQIYCFTLAFTPVHMCNLQAINAMGRSDVFLKLEILKKTIGITALTIAVMCFDTPIAIAMTGVFTTLISCVINAAPNKKLIGYSYFEQMRDLIPSFAAAVVMLIATHSLVLLPFNSLLTLAIQIPTGIIVYLVLSILFKLPAFKLLITMIRQR